ncbi:hypothetical protein AVEN_69690-1 [Araneus ventricosus]|uniref:Uncharacterized protein n=1 Tax=Araneus ventricosus TaxID=182803 RepID=A0A4Y2T4Q9_ARAVE|nr:hypothetical protein AVEN_69690-1 [Araneus ventricosus]
MEFSRTFKRILFLNRDIEKIPAPVRSHISSPKSPNLSPSRQDGRQAHQELRWPSGKILASGQEIWMPATRCAGFVQAESVILDQTFSRWCGAND